MAADIVVRVPPRARRGHKGADTRRPAVRTSPGPVPAPLPRGGCAETLATTMRIEDYALVGDLQSAALISTAGAVDWLCVPRFDSPSCFAALLGDAQHGRWQIAPAGGAVATSRRYRPGTLVLETDFETDTGAVRIIDFM